MDKSTLIERIKTLTQPIYPKRFNHATELKKIPGIKCVAFDFYGTMFISGVGDIGVDEEQQSSANEFFTEALQDTGFSTSSSTVGQAGLQQFEETINRHVDEKKENGIPYPEPDIINVWQDVLAALVQLNFIEGPVTKEDATRFAVEFEFRANSIWPVPHLNSILKKLLDKDLKLGIISNSQFYTPLAFEALMGNSTHAFGFDPDLQKWSYKFGLKKPLVDFYRKFTNELADKDLSPKEVLYVGNDLFKDVIPAKQLGLKTALYVGDRRSVRHEAKDLSHPEQQPDIIVDDLHQILECLA